MFKPYFERNQFSPFLAMSATNTDQTVLDMSRIFHVSLPPTVHQWASAHNFLKDNIKFSMSCTSEFKKIMVDRFKKYVDFGKGDHFLIYSNSKVACDDLRNRLNDIIRDLEIDGYLILLTGESFVEEKRYSIVALGDPSVSSLTLLGIIISGDVATAGLDRSTVE